MGQCISMCEDRIRVVSYRGRGKPDSVRGISFFHGGYVHISSGMCAEETYHNDEDIVCSVCIRPGTPADYDPVYLFLYRPGAYDRRQGVCINASNTFFSIIAAHFLMKSEKLTARKVIGCLVGFAGIIIINLEPGAWSSGFSWLGEGMVLVCAFSYGMSSVTLKMISDREEPVTITAYQLLFGGAVLIAIGAITGGKVQGFNMQSTLLLLYMSLLSTVAFSIWAELLKYNSVGNVAIFGFSIPIFGVALSAVFLGEQMASVKNLAALVCVSIGIIIINRQGHEA